MLTRALAEGTTPEQVRVDVQEVIRQLAGDGARVIVCTCSTLARVAEDAQVEACRVTRIDRPMAERAVASGRRIVLIGALPTALRQTADLLHRVASYGQRSLEMEEVLVPYAWPCFERGDTAGYLAYVRDAIESRARAGDVVVLAQASMAAVTEIYREPDVPVLSSPALGVAAAIAEYQSIVTARRQS